MGFSRPRPLIFDFGRYGTEIRTLVPNFAIPSRNIFGDEMQYVTKLRAKVSSLLLIRMVVAGSVPDFYSRT